MLDSWPYRLIIRFVEQGECRSAYSRLQALTLEADRWSVSVFRIEYVGAWYVIVLGDEPATKEKEVIQSIAALGVTSQLPSEILESLAWRRWSTAVKRKLLEDPLAAYWQTASGRQ